MKSLVDSVLKFLLHATEHDAHSRNEAYLAGAQDLPDLEYRMRELDRPTRQYGHLYTYPA